MILKYYHGIFQLLFLLSYFFLCLSVDGVVSEDLTTNPCLDKVTCGDCMGASEYCSWCSSTSADFAAKQGRCDTRENLLNRACPSNSIVSVENSLEYIKNDSPRDSTDDGPAIQLTPQKLKLQLRPNMPLSFTVNFTVAQNYPVDLYFLMDLSYTMRHNLKTLADITSTMASGIERITKDFRLGFGTFIDKTILPYTDLNYKSDQVKYNLIDPHCFKNQLGLTKNQTKFTSTVAGAVASGNLDGPEGGFDALMQVLACPEKIGWRPNSRRLVLFFTDADFHYAGDGKLGGILIPNDGECHLDAQGFYSEQDKLDYPSISQLINKISDTKTYVVFAITPDYQSLYSRLSALISGSAVGLIPKEDSATGSDPELLKIVKANYERITSEISLQTEADEFVKVTYSTNCDGKQPTSDIPHCANVKIGSTVTFNVTVTALRCPEKGSSKTRTITIAPAGITENLTIELEYMCKCDCEKPQNKTLKSRECRGVGTLACGVCDCERGYLGEKCQCENSDNLDLISFENLCIKPGSTLKCEGHGDCVCGKCSENCSLISDGNRYKGKYCECNDYGCQTHKGELCGGAERGDCECGKCKCKEDFGGEDCGCSKKTDGCKDSKGGQCNGLVGRCECNECKCLPGSGYQGTTCEDCPDCNLMCDARRYCVECYFQTLENSKEECVAQKCTDYKVTEVDSLSEDVNATDWRKCEYKDERDFCEVYFTLTGHGTAIQIQRTKKCPSVINSTFIIIVVVVGVIVLGLICLMIWKCYVTWHDRKEYARFLKSREHEQWNVGENEIYHKPVSTFANPTFKTNS